MANQWNPGCHIAIYDKNFNLLKDVDYAVNVEWHNTLPGGCDTAKFSIPETYEYGKTYLAPFNRIQIYWKGTLAWAGFMDEPVFNLADTETWDVNCVGYAASLQSKIIDYAAVTASAGTVLYNMLNIYVGAASPGPLYNVIVNQANIAAGPNTIADFKAKFQRLDAVVNQLAAYNGDGNGNLYEWLIDETRTFYYRAPATLPAHWAVLKRDVVGMQISLGKATQVRNDYLVSGTVAGTGKRVTGFFSDSTSMLAYGDWMGQTSFPAYTTSADLQQLATNLLAQTKSPTVSMKVTLFRPDDNPESLLNIKIGHLIQIFGFTDGTNYQDRILAQAYKVDDKGLVLEMELAACVWGFADNITIALDGALNSVGTKVWTRQAAAQAHAVAPVVRGGSWIMGQSILGSNSFQTS